MNTFHHTVDCRVGGGGYNRLSASPGSCPCQAERLPLAGTAGNREGGREGGREGDQRTLTKPHGTSCDGTRTMHLHLKSYVFYNQKSLTTVIEVSYNDVWRHV